MESKLTDEQRRDFAAWLIRDQANEVETLTVAELFEVWPEHSSLVPEDDPDEYLDISDEDLDGVLDAVRDAIVTVTWEV